MSIDRRDGEAATTSAAPPASEMASAGPSDSASAITLLSRLVLSIAAVAFFLYCMVKYAITPDVYWLWRGGQFILAEGALPETDILSWTFADQPVLLYQWLFMAGLALIEGLAGLPGVFVVFTAVALIIYFLAPLMGAVPQRVSAFLVVAVCALGLAVITVNLALRPMIVTSALLLVQYVVVQRLRSGRISRWAALLTIVLIYVTWANSHNGIVLGFGSLVLFALGDLAERRRWYPFDPVDGLIEGRPLSLGQYGILLAAAAAASLLNPYGPQIYAHLVGFTSQGFFAGAIEELRSPDFHLVQFQWFLLFIAGLFLAMMRITRLMSASDLLHLVVFTALTLVTARFVVWAVLFYVLIMPKTLHHLSATGSGNVFASLARGSAQTRRVVALAIAGLFIPFAAWVLMVWPARDNHCQDFAGALAAYQDLQQPSDRLFNSPGIGSCAFALNSYPKVFIDTRFDVYGEQFTESTVRSLRLRPGWRDWLDEWRIDTIVIESRFAMAQGLTMDPRAEILFDDGKAVVARWIPKTAELGN